MASDNSIAAIQATPALKGFGGYALEARPEPNKSGKDIPIEGKNLPTSQPADEPERDELEKAVSTMNEIGRSEPPHLEFSIDDETGHTVITMTHRQTGEVIRQIPSEEFLAAARMIAENSEKLAEHPGRWIETRA